MAGLFMNHRDCYLYFFIIVVYRSLLVYENYVQTLFCPPETINCGLLVWTRILDLGLHASRVLLCALISGAEFVSYGQRWRCGTLVSSRRHISDFRVLADRYGCLGVRFIGFKIWLYMCVMAFRNIDSVVMSVDVVKS